MSNIAIRVNKKTTQTNHNFHKTYVYYTTIQARPNVIQTDNDPVNT